MSGKIHAVAGVIAFITILTFFTSTIAVELFGSNVAIAAVKQAIVYGLFILVPSIATAGALGSRLGKGTTEGPVGSKKRRMPIIGANGILILLPAAIYLNKLASAGDFGTLFYSVQALELAAGATNLMLMSMNIRDGLKISGRFRASPSNGQ